MVDMVSVDPGLNTALAWWDGPKLYRTLILRAPPAKKMSDMDRMLYLFDRFTEALQGDDPIDTVYIEGVRSFQSARSWASSTRGNLALLSYIVGGYVHICQEYELPCVIVDPKWKGQLTEGALERRIRRAGYRGTMREHEREAIGLGYSVTGRL